MDKAHTKPSELSDVDLSVRVIRKQEFAKRLYKIIVARNLTQSELARLAEVGRDHLLFEAFHLSSQKQPSYWSFYKLEGIFRQFLLLIQSVQF